MENFIIFDTQEKKETATFSYNGGQIEPVFCGEIWILQEELLPVILENTTLTEEDLTFRPLTQQEIDFLNGNN